MGVNSTGMATVGDRPSFWAAPFEVDGEFGGLGTWPGPVPFEETSRTKRDFEKTIGAALPIANTTIAIVATDAMLTKSQLKRMAVAAQDGIARAVSPAHALVDGDIVFSVATGTRPVADAILDIMQIGHAAAVCLSRAIARGVYTATPAEGDLVPAWRAKWGSK